MSYIDEINHDDSNEYFNRIGFDATMIDSNPEMDKSLKLYESYQSCEFSTSIDSYYPEDYVISISIEKLYFPNVIEVFNNCFFGKIPTNYNSRSFQHLMEDVDNNINSIKASNDIDMEVLEFNCNGQNYYSAKIGYHRLSYIKIFYLIEKNKILNEEISEEEKQVKLKALQKKYTFKVCVHSTHKDINVTNFVYYLNKLGVEILIRRLPDNTYYALFKDPIARKVVSLGKFSSFSDLVDLVIENYDEKKSYYLKYMTSTNINEIHNDNIINEWLDGLSVNNPALVGIILNFKKRIINDYKELNPSL